ncbi:hypothetical protein [Enterovirga sp.]|uniref:hypothetical protein n=1 Tax=Enterovirga sp. TaxID=2026350 RepID=UPI002C189AF3|nr:hypothetical protein [Enterovirga sp.]HMO30395.1 hypothetical protein [Enterovirga sp.]
MTARSALTSSMFLLLAGAFSASPASAQYYVELGYGFGYSLPASPYFYNEPPPPGYDRPRGRHPAARAPRPLPAGAIVDRLEEMGFEDVGRPRFTGTLYIVQATGPGGMRQQIVVDAIRGIILNRTAVAGPPAPYGEEPAPRPRRYGGRPLDADELYPEPGATPHPAPRPRRGAAASGPARGEALPSPADPRLADPHPFEGRAGSRQARTESRGDLGTGGPGAPPFGIDPGGASRPKRSTKDGDGRKAAQPPPPPKKPVAEARPAEPKTIRVIPGVTPLNAGAGASQLDNLPQPPDPPPPTGE